MDIDVAHRTKWNKASLKSGLSNMSFTSRSDNPVRGNQLVMILAARPEIATRARSDVRQFADLFVVLAVTALATVNLVRDLDKFDGLDPLGHLESKRVFHTQSQRCSVTCSTDQAALRPSIKCLDTSIAFP